MGHTLADPDIAYHRLQQRLDRMPTGAPDSPVFQRILRLLFTPEEAELAALMPTIGDARHDRPPGRPPESTSSGPMVDAMARQGTRRRPGAPRAALCRPRPGGHRLLRVHLHAGPRGRPDGGAGRAVRRSTCTTTTPWRTRSSAAAPRSAARWSARRPSRATRRSRCSTGSGPPTSSARRRPSPSRCARAASTPSSSAEGCGAPTADLPHVRRVGGRPGPRRASPSGSPTRRGCEILAECKAAGLAQTADNVKHGHQLHVQLLRLLLRDDAVDPPARHHRGDRLVQLGRGGRPRPTAAAARSASAPARRRPSRWSTTRARDAASTGPSSTRNAAWAAGSATRSAATTPTRWSPASARVFTPENTFDRMVTMAVERGKLGDLLVDTLDGAGPHALARVLAAGRAEPARDGAARRRAAATRCSCAACWAWCTPSRGTEQPPRSGSPS